MNDRVADYRGLVESLARKIAAGPRARMVGAEEDDLTQEGLIAVWQALRDGNEVSAQIVELRMRGWLRYLGRQTPIPYEDMLPLEALDQQ